uniref:DUF4371 domain-containing protein n=1 Tax=Romanomermis culicivorax TaxID=13658 RepID=A0A915J8V7_ROMCU
MFTILADETLNSLTKEQLCLCIRFVKNNTVKERFLKFIDVVHLTELQFILLVFNINKHYGLQELKLIGLVQLLGRDKKNDDHW